MISHALIMATASAVLSANLGGQVTPKLVAPISRTHSTSGTAAGCPGGNGVHITATSGTVADSSSGVNTVIGLNQAVDTTLVLDISRKTWTRTNIAAAISVGVADESRGRYAICAGVAVLMPSATLTITGARGRVHFVASLKGVADALRFGLVQ
jgi:hypothetical protein